MFWWLIISIVLFFGPKIWDSYFTPRKAAQEIVADTMAVYSVRHDFAEVSAAAAEFKDLDHGFYARAKAEFEQAGFRYLVDMEDRTLTRQYPKMRTFVRLFLGDGGTISGAAFHGKVRGFWMRLLKFAGMLPARPLYFDLETEFADGTFLVTTNSFGAGFSSFAGIEQQAFSQTTSLDAMTQAHRAAVEQRCSEGTMPLRMYSVGEVWAMQHRLQDLKNAAKEALGYVDHEQIARVMAETPTSDPLAQADKDEEFAAELVRLRQHHFSGRADAQ